MVRKRKRKTKREKKRGEARQRSDIAYQNPMIRGAAQRVPMNWLRVEKKGMI
jgi:hypothetical protein